MSETVPLAYHEAKINEQKERYEKRILVLEKLLSDLSGTTEIVENPRPAPRTTNRVSEFFNQFSDCTRIDGGDNSAN